jgi:hypothetical protein
VDELDPLTVVGNDNNSVGVLMVRETILSFFDFLASITVTKASKFLFAESFLFSAQRCASQLFWRGIVPFIFYSICFVNAIKREVRLWDPGRLTKGTMKTLWQKRNLLTADRKRGGAKDT